ncbi:tRNA (adenine(22)-N(1))-methyltransferase TrmK [Bacillus sp. B15-48]|uniref:tRNA (adenine(22)-N(1))-methyltransferase n=1 Tax=Bacillus sp. B15-48 TaxID=1548601 RepID=UPI00193F8E0A|nr:tRNA (adenine(22)-N(1))-methyltransferase TrmK [Bacillus sp. B15-48]MBM4762319.1 tRNA (adenine(22)-N(1))-methyltransferase TrmK [Bacillus sp. B15-48]
MNTERLSDRLATVASYVPQGSKLADIGSDHAYLPCNLVRKDVVRFAIAGEVVEGPFQSALKQVQAEGLTDRISVRKGDGLEVIQPGEVDCITIAGMGGALITTILERGKAKLNQVKTIVLQPNIGAASIRKWMIENGWELMAETILMEDGKIYEILVGEKGKPMKPYSEKVEAEILFGPFLLKDRNDVFREKWTLEKQNWQRILSQLEKAEQNKETIEKKQEISRKILLVEEALQ